MQRRGASLSLLDLCLAAVDEVVLAPGSMVKHVGLGHAMASQLRQVRVNVSVDLKKLA